VEGTSYEYPATRLANKTLVEVTRDKGSQYVWLLYDFDPFHGRPNQQRNRNFLYADGHAKPL
jgi:prepilin-type processing-associated H-X9-DG protein